MNIAVVLAAGSGTRMGNQVSPKQFIVVNDVPLLLYSIKTFNEHKDIDKILVVSSKAYLSQVKGYMKAFNINKLMDVIIGGDTRQASVYEAIKYLDEHNVKDNDVILIHDSARPLVSEEIITNNIKGMLGHDAVDTVIPASDTIIRSLDRDKISEIQNRNELYMSQTPQTFRFYLIKEAHEEALKKNLIATDDARLVLNLRKNVHLVKGSRYNFKVTTNFDLDVLKSILNK